jgi:hypothetical protein
MKTNIYLVTICRYDSWQADCIAAPTIEEAEKQFMEGLSDFDRKEFRWTNPHVQLRFANVEIPS